MNPGARVDLPEVATALGFDDPGFEVASIHQGGMGVCVRLRHRAASGTFALKCIHPELLGDQQSIVRFRDEVEVWLSASACDAVAEALAVVRINEIPAVVATWLDAGDLTSALPRLGPAARFESVLRVCRGLHWVHSNLGVIHRDLKPGNILLDRNLLACVSDWGLARPLRAAGAQHSKPLPVPSFERPERTQRESFLGTVLYAAPEQFRDASSIDHRADIYALGCIMHELETGTPPFVGPDVPAIRHMHLNQAPPRLGGIFKKTSLGLEKVITRCLAKQPSARFQTYAELDAELLSVAKSRGFSTARCEIGVRKETFQLGKGERQLEKRIASASVKGNDVVVVEFDKIVPFLKEAADLMALGRYSEAEPLLKCAYLPDLCSGSTKWTLAHSFATDYALCIQHIRGRLHEALEIFQSLESALAAPPEYTVNYSFALIRDAQWARARQVCENGLKRFPDDLDILGNYTVSLRCGGDLDSAYANAERRLAIRRDVHSLHEAADVLEDICIRVRNADLPRAVTVAETANRLIAEGLRLNPNYGILRLARIRLFAFAHARLKALEACEALIHELGVSTSYRQQAFAECIDITANAGENHDALELLNQHDLQPIDETIAQHLQTTRVRVLTNIMIGQTNAKGQRLIMREVAEYVLKDAPAPALDAVTRARALEWMGHTLEAENVLTKALVEPSLMSINWEVHRQLVRFLNHQGRLDEAKTQALKLTKIGPWRAGSYDELNRVALARGEQEIAHSAKQTGDRVYEEEQKLFAKLRSVLS